MESTLYPYRNSGYHSGQNVGFGIGCGSRAKSILWALYTETEQVAKATPKAKCLIGAHGTRGLESMSIQVEYSSNQAGMMLGQ